MVVHCSLNSMMKHEAHDINTPELKSRERMLVKDSETLEREG